jgi:hypothetical protein
MPGSLPVPGRRMTMAPTKPRMRLVIFVGVTRSFSTMAASATATTGPTK